MKLTPFELEKTLETMKICVDSREKPTKEAKKRWENFGVPYEIEPLKSGDYTAKFILPSGDVFNMKDKCVIEYKGGLSGV